MIRAYESNVGISECCAAVVTSADGTLWIGAAGGKRPAPQQIAVAAVHAQQTGWTDSRTAARAVAVAGGCRHFLSTAEAMLIHSLIQRLRARLFVLSSRPPRSTALQARTYTRHSRPAGRVSSCSQGRPRRECGASPPRISVSGEGGLAGGGVLVLQRPQRQRQDHETRHYRGGTRGRRLETKHPG